MPRGPIGPAALSEKASVRLTPAEKAKLTRDRGALSESEYIRRLIVRGGIVNGGRIVSVSLDPNGMGSIEPVDQINVVHPPPPPAGITPSRIPADVSVDMLLDPMKLPTPIADRLGSRRISG